MRHEIYMGLFTLAAVGFTLLGIAVQRFAAGRAKTLMPRRIPPARQSGALRLTRFMDGIADGVIIGDLLGNLTYWNPAALRLHGYESLDEVRRHLSEFADTFVLSYPQGGIVPFEEWPMPKVMRGESVRDYELEMRRIDTGQRWVIRYTCAVIRVAELEDEQVVLTLQDLTERRRAERELQQNETHFRELIESLPQLVWTCGGDNGECKYLSPQFVQYTGVPLSEQLGFGWAKQVHPDDRERSLRAWQQASARSEPYEVEFRIRRADGAYRWFKMRALPLRDVAGQIVKWIGTNTDIHEERLLTDSKAVLAAIVEYSEDPIIGKSLDGTMTSWNRAAERVFGYRADETVGRNVSMLLPPDRLHEERDILLRVGAGEAIQHIESKRITKDGRLIDVSLTISPVRDASGRVIGASKIARDITAMKRDTHALRTSYSLLDAVVEGITDPVYVKDLNGRYLLANSALAAALNRPAAQVVGATDEEILGVENTLSTREADRRILTFEIPQTYEESIETETGLRHYLTTKAPFYDADRRPAGVLGISRDITARKWTEQALLASEKHLRGVLDSLLVYVAVLGTDGKLTAMNRAAREVFAAHGLRFEDVEKVSVLETPLPGMSADVRQTLFNAVERVRRGEEVRLDAICLFEGPPLMIVDLVAAPMPGNDAWMMEVIVSAVDVTQRELAGKRALDRQSELAHLERVRTIGQMAAGLAHELNQPLGAISNYAGACQRLLAADRLPAARLTQSLNDIQSEALRAGAIVHRLRGFVKKQLSQAVHSDPNTLVDEAIRLLTFDLRTAGIEPQLTLGGEMPSVFADPVQIGQVLINLIRNSLDAMQEIELQHRSLSIETLKEAVTGNVRFTVRDRGVGASPEEISRLFDAFYTTKKDGLGIGLSLCRTIIEDHGGHLSAQENPGGGLALSFTLLPAAQRTGKGAVS